jgi:hypothetical protein
VADLGEGAGGDRPPFAKKFSIFPNKKERKMNLYYLEWTLKSSFCRPQPLPSKKVPFPSKILDPPLFSVAFIGNVKTSLSKKTISIVISCVSDSVVQFIQNICFLTEI